MSVRISTLPNGMRIVTDAMPQVKTVSVGIWVDAGARDETPEINGVAHMLEHMAFKGTRRRSALAIAEEIEAVGGHLNAFTSREQTAYYARVMGGDMDLALDMLADILQHSVFDAEEMEREREVIIQEIGQAEDTPDDIIFDHLQETAFPGQSLGRSILGTVERVEDMQRRDLQGFLDRFYHAPNMVVVAAGAVDHDRLVESAGKLFAELQTTPRPQQQAAIYRGGERRVGRELEQAHVAVALPGVAYDDPAYYAMQVYATVLGGGMSSRLFQEVREKRGLAYSVYAYPASYRDGGLLTVYAGTGGEKLGDLMPVLADELAKLTGATIGEDELQRARAQLKVGLVTSLESSGARIEQLGRQMLLFGRPLDIDEVLNAVDRVDEAAVQAVAERVMRTAPPSVAALGPIGALEDYARFAGRFG